jgi:hypothetical protein
VAGVALSKITLEKEAHFDESRYARATAFQIDGWRSFCAAARDYAERASTLLTVRTQHHDALCSTTCAANATTRKRTVITGARRRRPPPASSQISASPSASWWRWLALYWQSRERLT